MMFDILLIIDLFISLIDCRNIHKCYFKIDQLTCSKSLRRTTYSITLPKNILQYILKEISLANNGGSWIKTMSSEKSWKKMMKGLFQILAKIIGMEERFFIH